MGNLVLKMSRTVIFSKIASVILDMEKSEDLQQEDFLSILKPSEITRYGKNWIEISQKIKIMMVHI